MYSTTTSTTSGAGLGFVLLLILAFYLVILALGLASYILTSLSLYKIADRRQIQNPVLAWIPVASDWILGSIADDQNERLGIKSKWRVALLALLAAYVVAFILIYVVAIAMAVGLGFASEMTYSEPSNGAVALILVPIIIMTVILMLVMLAYTFAKAICVYKVFESTLPDKAMKYTLIYFLVPLGGPLCLFKCRDKGYSKPRPVWGMMSETYIPAAPPSQQEGVQEAPASTTESAQTENTDAE